MPEPKHPLDVIVGIDGSLGAIRAARWAVDEVAGTDAALRLIYCSGPDSGADPEAVRVAREAMHAAGAPVDFAIERVAGPPVTALIEASKSARLLCLGHTESISSGFGSMAMKVVELASCPVAIIRGEHHVDRPDTRAVVALVDGSADDDAVLGWGFDEAQRRSAPLVLMTAYRTEFDLLQEDTVLREHDERMRSLLDGYLAAKVPRYPSVRVRSVTAFSTFCRYLNEHATTVQLAVVSAGKTVAIYQLLGASDAVASRERDFSLLVVR